VAAGNPCRAPLDHYYIHQEAADQFARGPAGHSTRPAHTARTMPEPHRLLGVYLHLARASQLRMQPMVRDKLLVLAGVQAESMGLAPISALCRKKVLAHNARHMLRDWPTLEVALADERFCTYLKRLNRRYSKERAEHMLDTLGIELGRERELYSNDLEYAAALLDTEPEAIDDILGAEPRPTPRGAARQSSNGSSPAPALPASAAGAVRASRMRAALVVWGPFVLGLSALAIAAVLSRTLLN